MLFSRFVLNQLAKVNASNLHSLLSKQRNLESLKLKKIQLSDNIKKIIKTKNELPDDSGVFKSSLNINVLKTLGYEDLNDLINQLSINEEETKKELNEVKVLKESVQDSLSLLSDVDTTKDMQDQVVNEVILDSQLDDIREKSHEILLMLSTEKDSSFLAKSQKMIQDNEKKISNHMIIMKKSHNDQNTNHDKKVEEFNNTVNDMNEEIQGSIKDKDSVFNKVDHALSKLSSTKKNIILGGVFLSSVLLGLSKKSDGKKK